jgi:hypothetical protein
MAKPLSDHIPCTVQIGTTIPKAYVFRFENVRFQHRGFLDMVQATRDTQVQSTSSAARIAAKFKILQLAANKIFFHGSMASWIFYNGL